MDWLYDLIPFFKGVHVAMLAIWCGALAAMPLLLTRHDTALTQEDYSRVRRATHLTYTLAATPSAVITVIAGTWLIFLRETLVPWFYAKLFFVVLLVLAHAWIGHILVTVAEQKGRHRPPPAALPLVALLVPVLAILFLVLAKPDLGWIVFPDWMTTPRGQSWPLDVPSP